MDRNKVLDVVRRLKPKDSIAINDWDNAMQVVGVSERFVLAHSGQEYTIISKQPTDRTYNGVMAGDMVCASDDWVLGYAGGYHFDDPVWVEEYMKSLESGETEMSMRNRATIRRILDAERLFIGK